MALKKQFPQLATFSMSSMTDVIFLLLIFFMVTSTIIFPTALPVNLPESSTQTDLKPVTEVYVDSLQNLYIIADRNDSVASAPRPVADIDALRAELSAIQQTDSLRAVALNADRNVKYDIVVQILDMAAQNNMKMVLATRAAQRTTPSQPATTADDPLTPVTNE
ncbi:MAG: biopolymer transporter ExbD [Muribaculaceae bacterium]|nr:biopolymer transporter ExbD [Muribaculaceae bacterium]